MFHKAREPGDQHTMYCSDMCFRSLLHFHHFRPMTRSLCGSRHAHNMRNVCDFGWAAFSDLISNDAYRRCDMDLHKAASSYPGNGDPSFRSPHPQHGACSSSKKTRPSCWIFYHQTGPKPGQRSCSHHHSIYRIGDPSIHLYSLCSLLNCALSSLYTLW